MKTVFCSIVTCGWVQCAYMLVHQSSMHKHIMFVMTAPVIYCRPIVTCSRGWVCIKVAHVYNLLALTSVYNILKTHIGISQWAMYLTYAHLDVTIIALAWNLVSKETSGLLPHQGTDVKLRLLTTALLYCHSTHTKRYEWYHFKQRNTASWFILFCMAHVKQTILKTYCLPKHNMLNI